MRVGVETYWDNCGIRRGIQLHFRKPNLSQNFGGPLRGRVLFPCLCKEVVDVTSCGIEVPQPMFRAREAEQGIHRRNFLVRVERVIAKSELPLHHFFERRLCLQPILTDFIKAKGSAVFQHPVFRSRFNGKRPNAFSFVPELLFHQNAALDEQLD